MFPQIATVTYVLAVPPAEVVEPEPTEPVAKDITPQIDALAAENDALRQRMEELEQARSDAAENAGERESERDAELDALRESNEALADEVAAIRQGQEQANAKLQRQAFLTGRLHGYLDAGFFFVSGDGSGTRPDLGTVTLELDGVARDDWVFMGDPLSTAINARGDVADTGDSQAVAFDPIGSRGNPTFLVNAFNVAPSIGLGERIAVEGMVDFLPRGQTLAPYGETAITDYLDIKLAYVLWRPATTRFDVELSLGKVDSAFGREYRTQEAPDRTTVTPSLMCRYTCGRPTGIKSRWRFLDDRQLAVNLSLTNGSTMQPTFGTSSGREHNAAKTATGRVSYQFPVGAGLELGGSGLAGAQDLQSDSGLFQWQYGVDAHLSISGVEVTAEFLQVRMPGREEPGQAPCAGAQCLDARSAYGLFGYRVTNWLMPYMRVDWRDAEHRLGGVFHYESTLMRFTPGVRFEVGEHMIVKGEYTFNRELGRIPQFPNDVLTTSVVARF